MQECIVRKFTQFVLITAAIMAAPSAFAEMKIAVLNYQMALLESDAANNTPWMPRRSSAPS